MLKVDLHLHTGEDRKDLIKYSAAELIDCAVEKGFDVIAITNHNLFTYDSGLADYAKKRGILLIPGVEAAVEGKHVVILNCGKDIEKIMTFSSLREYKKSHPEIFILAPHPFYPNIRRHSLQGKLLKNMDVFDAVEYCHYYTRFFDYFNNKALKTAKRFGKPVIGTSDAHHLFQFGKTYSLVEAEKNIPSILMTIKENKIKIKSRPLSSITCSKTALWMLIKFFVKKVLRAGSV